MTLANLPTRKRATWPLDWSEESPRPDERSDESFELPHRPRPQYPWDTDMTLCIGVLATEPVPFRPCIVLCFDYKVSNDAWGAESEYKFR